MPQISLEARSRAKGWEEGNNYGPQQHCLKIQAIQQSPTGDDQTISQWSNVPEQNTEGTASNLKTISIVSSQNFIFYTKLYFFVQIEKYELQFSAFRRREIHSYED